jgi:diaminohydroxyphosphoribosylaminopyrimidine deaminase/5-amino-6-(5-phosphoribosylamino)uracil reductase
MNHLVSQQIQSLIIEGGPFTLKQFIDRNLWDEARIFTTGQKLIKGKKTPLLIGKITSDEMVGKDKLQILMNR